VTWPVRGSVRSTCPPAGPVRSGRADEVSLNGDSPGGAHVARVHVRARHLQQLRPSRPRLAGRVLAGSPGDRVDGCVELSREARPDLERCVGGQQVRVVVGVRVFLGARIVDDRDVHARAWALRDRAVQRFGRGQQGLVAAVGAGRERLDQAPVVGVERRVDVRGRAVRPAAWTHRVDPGVDPHRDVCDRTRFAVPRRRLVALEVDVVEHLPDHASRLENVADPDVVRVLAVRVGPEVGHHEEVGVRILLVAELYQVFVAQRRVRPINREERAARRERRLVDQVVVTVAGRRRDLRRELVAEVDVDVLLAHDPVQASVPATWHGAVRFGNALGLVYGVARAGVRDVVRHDRVDDVVTGDQRVVPRIRSVVAEVGAQVVAVRAVVGECVAAVEGAFLRLLTRERHLQAVRPDLRVELAGDVRAAEVQDRVAVLGEAGVVGVYGILVRVGLLPVVGDVLVHDDVVVGVRESVRPGLLQQHSHVRDRGFVVLVRLEARVELVAGRSHVGDAHDLAGRPGVVPLPPVDRRSVPFQQLLVHEQAAAQRVRDAGIDRRAVDEARRRDLTGPFVVHGRTRVG
jgi:hypothetical protein